MGFASFTFKRSTGGYKTIRFPDVQERLKIENGWYSFSDLVNIPNFPTQATVFVYSEFEREKVRNFGFDSIIVTKNYVGETWTLENGSKIFFEDASDETYKHTIIHYYDNDGNELHAAQSVNEAVKFEDSDIIYSYITVVFGYTIYHKSNYESYESGNFAETSSSPDLYYANPGLNDLQFFDDAFPSFDRPDYNIYGKFFGDVTPVYNNDPYATGGSSGIGGGNGNFTDTSEDILIPNIPQISATDSGFMTLYNPTLSELNALSSYMWSDLFDLNGWQKLYADPIGAILGLSIVPVQVNTTNSRYVKVGNISTGISMAVIDSQYVVVDCGTLNVNEFWGAYLDYAPYTKAEIYLPYIGTHTLSTDDIMNKSIHVVYHVDILSGACCAYIQCGGTVLYSFVGQCASSIPITGDNWTNVINGALSIAGSIGSMVATGGATAPMAIGNIASTAVNSMKPTVEKSGSLGGTGGFLGIQTPYLILTRPRQAVPSRQSEFTGYPSFITELLGDLTGYTEVEYIHLENVPATEPELSEIESLLKSGVIF